MSTAGVAVDDACLTQALRACGRAGASDAARELLERSQRAYGLTPGDRAWRSAIQACAKAAQPNAALQIRKLLDEAVAAGAAGQGVWGAAMHALAYQPSAPPEAHDGAPPDAHDGASPGSPAAQCLALLCRIDEEGIRLDLGMCNAVLHACQRAGDWAAVRELLFRMRAEQLTSADTMEGYHLRLWKRAKLELELCAAPDPKSRRSKQRAQRARAPRTTAVAKRSKAKRGRGRG